MVAAAASVLDSYPDTTEVVILFHCVTQVHRLQFRLIRCHTPQAFTLGNEDKTILSHHAKMSSTETTGSVASPHQQHLTNAVQSHKINDLGQSGKEEIQLLFSHSKRSFFLCLSWKFLTAIMFSRILRVTFTAELVFPGVLDSTLVRAASLDLVNNPMKETLHNGLLVEQLSTTWKKKLCFF